MSKIAVYKMQNLIKKIQYQRKLLEVEKLINTPMFNQENIKLLLDKYIVKETTERLKLLSESIISKGKIGMFKCGKYTLIVSEKK